MESFKTDYPISKVEQNFIAKVKEIPELQVEIKKGQEDTESFEERANRTCYVLFTFPYMGLMKCMPDSYRQTLHQLVIREYYLMKISYSSWFKCFCASTISRAKAQTFNKKLLKECIENMNLIVGFDTYYKKIEKMAKYFMEEMGMTANFEYLEGAKVAKSDSEDEGNNSSYEYDSDGGMKGDY